MSPPFKVGPHHRLCERPVPQQRRTPHLSPWQCPLQDSTQKLTESHPLYETQCSRSELSSWVKLPFHQCSDSCTCTFSTREATFPFHTLASSPLRPCLLGELITSIQLRGALHPRWQFRDSPGLSCLGSTDPDITSRITRSHEPLHHN